ncbi:MAG: hypothetical protein HYV28_15095 [Ignavibacteriales bacterium]|nr:hypothetical protein [Ignavibacteriales bacterium]
MRYLVAKARLDHINALAHASEEGDRIGRLKAFHEWKLEVASRMIVVEYLMKKF